MPTARGSRKGTRREAHRRRSRSRMAWWSRNDVPLIGGGCGAVALQTRPPRWWCELLLCCCFCVLWQQPQWQRNSSVGINNTIPYGLSTRARSMTGHRSVRVLSCRRVVVTLVSFLLRFRFCYSFYAGFFRSRQIANTQTDTQTLRRRESFMERWKGGVRPN